MSRTSTVETAAYEYYRGVNYRALAALAFGIIIAL